MALMTSGMRTLCALLAMLFASTIAFAGGPSTSGSMKDGPYVPPPPTWTGAYIGLTTGYGWGDSRFNDGVSSNPFDIDGWAFGGTLGYNMQWRENIVLGIEADISFADISGSFGPGNLGQPGGGGWGCGSGPCHTELNWFGTLRGRAGFTANWILIYATGGLAYGDFDAQIRNAPDWRTGDVAWGWTAGAGVEFILRPGWTAKIEYLHVDLGWTDRTDPNDFKADAEFDMVRLGLNYRFGADHFSRAVWPWSMR